LKVGVKKNASGGGQKGGKGPTTVLGKGKTPFGAIKGGDLERNWKNIGRWEAREKKKLVKIRNSGGEDLKKREKAKERRLKDTVGTNGQKSGGVRSVSLREKKRN